MSGKGQEKKANKAKNKNAAREQAAQAQTTQSSRDNNAKPSSYSAPRKPAEAQVKPASPVPKSQPVAEEPHVPMNGFNAAEVEAMLNSCATEEVEHYVPDKPTPVTNPGIMANGQDFWLELRRQVTELQANGGLPKEAENKKQGG